MNKDDIVTRVNDWIGDCTLEEALDRVEDLLEELQVIRSALKDDIARNGSSTEGEG